MDYFMKLPRNGKEFTIFMLIISIISVNIIAPLITFLELGFSLEVWGNTYKSIPFIWICVIILVLLTKKPASLMTDKILKKEDSFNAHILVNIMCTVLMMSVVLTIVAPMIATCTITTEPLEMFFARWPRNFAVAFAIEVLVAQPIARFVMLKMHQYADKKNSNLSQVKQNSQNQEIKNISKVNENEKEDNKIKETNENLDENKND